MPLPVSISRYLFILPAPHHWVYLGLTDEDNPGLIPDVPETPEEDIDFLLHNIIFALEQSLSRDDVIGTFTGLRLLIDSGEGGSTADISRKHALIRSRDGAFAVVAQAEIARPLEYLDGTDVTRAEVAFALTHEGAMNAADILQRRTRLGLVKDDASRVDWEVQEIIAEVAEKENYDVIS